MQKKKGLRVMLCAEMEERMGADMTALGETVDGFSLNVLLGLAKQEVKRCDDILPLKGFF